MNVGLGYMDDILIVSKVVFLGSTCAIVCYGL